jgi:hypothetical protein
LVGKVFQRFWSRGLVEEHAAIPEQHLHMVEDIEFGRLWFLALIDGGLKRPEPLLQANQPMGEGRDRLGEVFGRARDPKGNRFGGHLSGAVWPMTTQIDTRLKPSSKLAGSTRHLRP